MSKRFEIKESVFLKEINIYISVSVDNINPLEIEKDIILIKEFLLEKYHKKELKKESFKEYIKRKLKL